MNKQFQIGKFCFQLRYTDLIAPPPNFMLFENTNVTPEYTYDIVLVKDFPDPEGQIIAKREDLLVYQQHTLENRLIGVKGIQGYYAYYQEISKNSARVLVDQKQMKDLNIDPVFTSLLALERRMLPLDNMVLHCAYVSYRGEAILFSAPSETGKTTQANLWEQYRGSRTINGDRALLGQVDGRWAAQGWPVCGTSEICHNLTVPVRAIVMLEQGKEDTVRRLGAAEAFPLLYSQLTVNRWNRSGSIHAMDLMDSILKEVPIYLLRCTISEESVCCLERVLYD